MTKLDSILAPKVNNFSIKDLKNSEVHEISNNELKRMVRRISNKI
jgi:uncharacterized membrane protein YheB (UPF0754 family)